MTRVYEAAIRLLSRREHGALELKEKLCNKGHAMQDVCDALEECQRQGYQSDMRYAEQVCRARFNQGIGPLRIRQELQSQRIDESLIEQALAELQHQWLAQAKAVWLKKFSHTPADSFEQRQKQKRFLAYRGFPSDIIAKALDD